MKGPGEVGGTGQTGTARIAAVLFDWGDTLFAPPDATEIIADVARARGITLDADSARAIWDELWSAGKTEEELARGRDLSPEAHRAAWTSLFQRADHQVPGIASVLYERVMDPAAWRPYPDADSTLRALGDRAIRVGVVSNVPRRLDSVFAAHGMAGLVDAFVHSFEVGAEKPDPRIFLAACKQLGTLPSATLMVGDHPVTDGGATAAGLQFHLLPEHSGYGERGLAAVVDLVDRSGTAPVTRG